MLRFAAVTCALGAVLAASGCYFLYLRPLPPDRGADIGSGMLLVLGGFIFTIGLVVMGAGRVSRVFRRAQTSRRSGGET
jgi:hypothetical protein